MRKQCALLVLAGLLLLPAAAQAAQPHSWSGPYGGINLGDDWIGDLPVLQNRGLPSGTLAGLQVGYNLGIGKIVLGVESDLALPNLLNSPSCGGTVILCDDSSNLGEEFVGSLRLRAGFAMDRLLIYGTGGYAYSSLVTQLATPGFGSSTFRSGWTIGGGAEYALGDHASIGLEYRNTTYRHIDADLGLPPALQLHSNQITFRLNFR